MFFSHFQLLLLSKKGNYGRSQNGKNFHSAAVAVHQNAIYIATHGVRRGVRTPEGANTDFMQMCWKKHSPKKLGWCERDVF